MGNFIDFILKTARCSYMYLHNFVIKHLNGQDEKIQCLSRYTVVEQPGYFFCHFD